MRKMRGAGAEKEKACYILSRRDSSRKLERQDAISVTPVSAILVCPRMRRKKSASMNYNRSMARVCSD
jgi:hypothetical protein